MSKMTLLEMTQSILATTDGDEVNDINDTTESIQIVTILRDVFYEMLSRRNWPHLKKFITLENVGDVNRPTHIRLPDEVQEIMTDSVQYDKRQPGDTRSAYENIKWLDPDAFLRMTNSRDTSADNTLEVTDFDGAKIIVITDTAPHYYTSFDDDYIVTDSYDAGIDDTIQNSKFQVRGYVLPGWGITNDFTPDLPAEVFPTYLAEAKSECSIILQQQANPKAEQKAMRGDRRMARKAWKTSKGVMRPNYGRKSYKSRSGNPPFNDN